MARKPRDREKQRLYNAAYRAANLEKLRVSERAKYHANPEKMREYQRKRKYGVAPEQYTSMLSAQGGVCAICKGGPAPKRRLHIDHRHPTEDDPRAYTRALLCRACNHGVGNFKDDPDLVLAVHAYLLEWNAKSKPQLALVRDAA